MQRFIDHIVAYYDLHISKSSDKIIKRLQMRLNTPQCGHKEGQQFPFLVRYVKKNAVTFGRHFQT